MLPDPKQIASALAQHVTAAILPFWRRHGIDHDAGGFITDLERDGQRAGDTRKSLVMQARMVDAFAAAWQMTGEPTDLDAARQGFRFLVDCMFASDDNRWLSLVERDGSPLEERIHAYGLTAVIQALAHFGAAANDPQALELAMTTAGEMEMFFWDGRFDGYYDSLDAQWRIDETTKSLDVHLHAVEATFALWDATGEDSYAETVEKVCNLILCRATDPASGVVLEKFKADWQTESDDFEPTVQFGHLFKAAWLALGACGRDHREAYLDFARRQLDFAVRYGVDPRAGVYETATPDGDVLNPGHSWWPQCEAIAALARAWRTLGDETYAALLERLVAYCFKHFHDPQFGEWYSRLGTQNDVLDPRKGHRRKCAYPIVRALSAAVSDLRECRPGA
jgi:mannose/cellobiose epimerase-like protein (N-acyl-D-glucosamine 2-epimerase family)